MKTFRLAGASVNQTPLDWKNNVDNIIASIRSAKKEKVDILCLPELCLTAYGCQDLFLSKWLADEAQSYLQPIIDECEEILVTVGLPLYHNNLSLNCVVVIENKKIIGISAKQHMARDGVHYEPRWFDPWPAHKKEMISFLGSEVLLGDIIYDF
ncbi:MAG: NAD+ synthetase, partial [Cyclobacteriaceae bacterium]|nr:NAD+ synthetase [Cyclobacteriaceae bacterium]